MTKKAFVLLSGGMDSTTCLLKAANDYTPEGIVPSFIYERVKGLRRGEIPWVEAYSVFYGQRHSKEMEFAAATCKQLGIKHSILDVGALLSGKNVMLTRESVGNVVVPDISYDDIKGVSPTYVPFRNGLLLSAIAAQAQKWVNEQNEEANSERYMGDEQMTLSHNAHKFNESLPRAGVYFGAHAEDAHNWAYPDCTPEFIGAMANAIHIGSYYQVRLHTPLEWLGKDEVVTLGEKLGVSWKDTWSCYKGEELHCGTCPTCRSRKGAFIAAGVEDPTEYAA